MPWLLDERDDLALNVQQVTGVKADRDLTVVWAVAKGSLLNKCSSFMACTFGTYACLSLGLIWYQIYQCRCKNCIHAPAALRLSARCFCPFHGTNIRFVADRAASWINGGHEYL
jgi:hypothetical protein